MRSNAFFWRNSTGHEVDLLIDEGAHFSAVEIKSGETLNPEFFKGLRYFERLSGNTDDRFYVIYGGDRDVNRKHGQAIGWSNITDFRWL